LSAWPAARSSSWEWEPFPTHRTHRILKQSDTGVVRGLTTAASLWTTAAIGAAVAYRRFDLAVVLTLVNFVILHWMKRTKQDDT
jgi:hypothetical protein